VAGGGRQRRAVRRRSRRLSRLGARPCAAGTPADEDRVTRPAAERRAQKREEAEARQRLADQRKPLQSRQSAIEQDLERLGGEKDGLDAWLASSDAYAEDAKERLVAAIARQGELAWTLARLEAQWLDVAAALEQLERDQPTNGPGR